jgi:glycosyltransferase involved in cell wall biosynthesis
LPDRLWFAVPGNIETLTGGTIYDKKVIAALRAAGSAVQHLQWPSSFPFPSPDDLAAVACSLGACPDGALILIDGLAFGVMPELAAAEAERLRLVALVHHPLALEAGLPRDSAERLVVSEREALKHVRAVIVTSDMTARTLTRDYGVAREAITVATPGIDRRQAACIRPANPVPKLVAVGTVTPRKGYDVLVDGLAKISHLDWHFTVAGSLERDPKTASAVRTQIEELGLNGRIDLIGEIPDPARLYETADIFVLPTRYEGYGMAIAEALAYGVPVVATRVGAIPDVMPGSAGILVPRDDPAALAGALRGFALWPDTAARIASALDAVK